MNFNFLICSVAFLFAVLLAMASAAAVTADLSDSTSASTPSSQKSWQNKMRTGGHSRGGGGGCVMHKLAVCANTSTDEASKEKWSNFKTQLASAKTACNISMNGNRSRSFNMTMKGSNGDGPKHHHAHEANKGPGSGPWGKKFNLTNEQMAAFKAKVKKNTDCLMVTMGVATSDPTPKLNMTAVTQIMMDALPEGVNTKVVDTFKACLGKKEVKMDGDVISMDEIEPRVLLDCTTEAAKTCAPKTAGSAESMSDSKADNPDDGEDFE